MEIIDNLEESNPLKTNHNLLLRYFATGVFFWIALVNFTRLIHDYFQIVLFWNSKSAQTIFWLSELTKLLLFFLGAYLFLKILNKYNLADKKSFLTILISLCFVYIVSFIAIDLSDLSNYLYLNYKKKVFEMYEIKAYLVLNYLQAPLKLLITGLVFYKKIGLNNIKH